MATIVTRSGKGSPLTNSEVDSNFTNLNTDKLELSGGTMSGDIDGNGNKVLFANVYSTTGDLPSASTYHGMFAHVHGTGKGYFAHAGNWVPLANDADKLNLSGGTMTGDLTVPNLITSGNVDGRDIATNIPASLGTAGQVLTVNSGGTAGEWATAGGGSPDLYTDNYVSGNKPVASSSTNGVAIGRDAIATNTNSLALGYTSEATGSAGFAGAGGHATGNNTIAIGNNATASASLSSAYGNSSLASSFGSTAFGYDSHAQTNNYATALGYKASASGTESIGIATSNNTTSYGAISPYGIAIGYQAKAQASDRSIAIGSNTVADYRAVAIGYNAGGTGSYGISLGSNSGVGIYASSAAIGHNVQSTASNQVSIGGSTQDVRISETYTLPKVDGTASGQVLTTDGSGTVSWATAGGGGADLYDANESSPTAQPSATGTNAIAIGDSAVSSGIDSFAGSNSRASGTASVAFSVSNNTTSYGASGSRAASIGFRTIASGSNAFSAGYYAKASGTSSIALGQSTEATHTRSLAFGNYVNSSASDQVSIGSTSDTVRISERYTLPTVTGTNGQVLTSDGSGTSSWATPASGGGGADLYTANESSPTAQPSATGTNAIAIGDSAISTGSRTVAFSKSRSAGWDSIAGAILNNTASYGTTSEGNIAFGEKAKVTGSASQGIGKLSITSGSQSMGLGYTATASGLRSYAFGYGAEATGTDTVSIGRSVTSTASNQVNIGGSTQDVRISETYTLPKVDGTASGQVLTTNGSGVVSWATPASGGGADLYDANESSPTAQPSATGSNAIAIGERAVASGTRSLALGYFSYASSTDSVSLGMGRSMGGSSFAAVIDSDLSSYGASGSGSIAMGDRAKGWSIYAIAIGRTSQANGVYSIAIGYNSNASAGNAVAIGSKATASSTSAMSFCTSYANYGNVSSAANALTMGDGNSASATSAIATGYGANSTVQGKHAHANGSFGDGNAEGSAQRGTFVLRCDTTDATAEALRTSSGSASTNNQITLPNNSCYGFTGTVIARENSAQTNDFAVWEIKGGAVRAGSASTTALGTYNINKISESTGAANWSIALSADTTNGAVAITVTGEASHNIRWVATVNTTEVTY